MIEVEIKVKISDPNQVRKRFEENKGVYKISLHHEDTYFNMPKGLRDFKQTDEALRLRKSIEFNRDNKAMAQKINYFITYKGKKIDKTTKTREEIEVKINERELYEFLFKDMKIEALIDYLPILKQHFVEVELMTESYEDIEKSKKILFQFLEKFGIMKEESIRRSYLELIAEKLKKRI